MQLIAMQLEDEQAGVVEKSDLNFAEILLIAQGLGKESYPWLNSVDPYGLTLLNLYQAPYFLAELETLSKVTPGEEIRNKIKQVSDFLKKVQQHTYIRLIGD